jgi:hypothetical protein
MRNKGLQAGKISSQTNWNVAQGAFLSETGTGCMGNSHRCFLKEDSKGAREGGLTLKRLVYNV